MKISADEYYINQTLRLAKKGLSWTNPNPLVGAIIVKDNEIIGQGFHHQAGQPHAEIEALNRLTANPTGATLYVNLEPCATFGKTPPCVDTIIKSKIKRVVCATVDPNPKNHGQGIIKLQKAGIQTSTGILENQARKLNETFFTFHQKKRPFIAIKFAASLDGKIATFSGDSKWITNQKAREYARSLRANYQAILVGINTVLADNPHLGIRIKCKKDPLRIILDSKLQIPFTAQVLRDKNAIIATTTHAPKTKVEKLKKAGFNILVFDSKEIPVPNLLEKLKKLEIISILVEGGGETLGNFVDLKIVDKVYAFQSPIIIGGKEAISINGKGVNTIKEALYLKDISHKNFGDNLLTIGYLLT